MSKLILFDEFHITVLTPPNLRADVFRAIRQTLDDARFRAALRRAIRGVFGKYPSLGKLTFSISR
jgi:hypothetical protein